MSDLSDYVNPEPPPEITKIKNEDLIGETLFSKTWLCELLLKLIKDIDSEISVESEFKTNDEENTTSKELDPDIEKDLCDLWDMSVEQDVCLALDELNSIQIFEGYIRKFHNTYPRAVEIFIGILVNMATINSDIRLKLVKNKQFIQYIFFQILGQMADVQSVIQALNLFSIFLSDESVSNSDIKVEFIQFLKEKIEDNSDICNWNGIIENFLFILNQSLNLVLLDSASNFLFYLLDSDDEYLMAITVNEHLVESICNAAFTRIKLERTVKTFNHSNFTAKTDDKSTATERTSFTPTPSASRIIDTATCSTLTTQFSEEEIAAIDTMLHKYFLCLQRMSTCENGVAALFAKYELTKQLFNEYLDRCLVTFNDWEIRTSKSLKASVGEESMQNLLCVLSILNCIFSNQSELSMTGSLVEFLIKLVHFCKQYLMMFIELKKCKDYQDLMIMASGNYELVKINLKDLFLSLNIKDTQESYHLNRLSKLIKSCNSFLE